jgi:high-affinity iron transporter
LDYLAVDYGGAVKDGKVLSLPEYKEQLEFVKTVGELSQTLPEVSASPEIQTLVQNLTHLIRSKADPEKVATLARRTQAKVIERVHLPTGPSDWPNLETGKRLFLNSCAQCHGAGGQGDGPSALALNPKPFNFLEDPKMGRMSPFQAFNSIRLGVPGTGMAGFPNFSDQDAWSLAFYVLSLRYQSFAAPGSLGEEFKKISNFAANQPYCRLAPPFLGRKHPGFPQPRPVRSSGRVGGL